MKYTTYIKYIIIFIVMFLIIQYLTSIILGSSLDVGPYENRIIVISLSLLSAIVIACTIILVDKIEELSNKLRK